MYTIHNGDRYYTLSLNEPPSGNYYYNSETELYVKETDKLTSDIPITSGLELDQNTVLCTMVKNEDDYIIQWIEYHKLLGIEKFIIYDQSVYKGPEVFNNDMHVTNNNDSNLDRLLASYISTGVVTLIKWPHPYRTKKHPAPPSAQVLHIAHAIALCKTARYIGFFDIDEYIITSEWKPIRSVLDEVIDNYDTSPGLTVKSKVFTNPDLLPEDGYNFMKIPHASKFSAKPFRMKTFVIPKNVSILSVHKRSWNIQGELLTTQIVKPRSLYYNHYLTLNKPPVDPATISWMRETKHDIPVEHNTDIMSMYHKLSD